MNLLSYIHIHRLPNPSGVGRVIDQLLSAHAQGYPDVQHRMLVDGKLYDHVYLKLAEHWKKTSFIPHRGGSSLQQAKWIMFNKPAAEAYWKEVDVVYCPAESYMPVRNAGLVCTIHDVAGFEDSLYPDSRNRRAHCAKWKIMFKRMAEYADAVVTVSHFSASRIAYFFPALESKLHVIHNAPYGLFGSEPDPDELAQVERLTGGAEYVLVPGGLTLRKNASLILRTIPLIIQKMPDVRIVITGSSSPEYKDELAAFGSRKVIQGGYVSDELLNALYSRAAVVWFPSRYEGFGMPVVEAMAAGAPVVTSHAASIPEVAGTAAQLCDIDDPRQHLEAIDALIASPALRREISERSIAHAATFTWDASAEKLNHLFRSI